LSTKIAQIFICFTEKRGNNNRNRGQNQGKKQKLKNLKNTNNSLKAS
jgi:hypothetical protein